MPRGIVIIIPRDQILDGTIESVFLITAVDPGTTTAAGSIHPTATATAVTVDPTPPRPAMLLN